MLLLCLFALLAGAGTAVSPCVLPVLPALLSAGATGGRRRPLGIVLGLAVTFTVTIVGLAELVDGVGLGTDVTRDIAVFALAGFGVALAVPAVGARLEAPLSRLARLGPTSRGDGFASGIGVGAALGFVYAPCAGPILGAVVAVSAASGRTVAVGASYAVGSAAMLLLVATVGRAAIGRLAGGARVQPVLGAVMVATAAAMLLQLDVRFQTAIADHLPSFVVNPTRSLEDSGAVKDRLADLRGRSRFEVAAAGRPDTGLRRSGLPVLGPAPEFQDTGRWFNSPPLTMAGLRARHRVVLIDFWTYTCINCLRTLPYLEAWDARYRDKGLTIVGVHSPEFPFEKDAGNVAAAIRRTGIRYPVVQDNDLGTWQAWSNQYWPAEYLVDARGQVRHVHFGEGEYDKTEAAIRSVLADAAGTRELGPMARPHGVVMPGRAATPETYLGALRAQGWQQPPRLGGRDYGPPPRHLKPDVFAFGGIWIVHDDGATAVRDATITANIHARDAYLVLSGPGAVRVDLDGRPRQTVHVREQRLYHLVHLARTGDHLLRVHVPPGTTGFAFTFG